MQPMAESGSLTRSHGPVMNTLLEVRLKDDNWIGKTDPAERRKRQNRLNQRAWRRRQKEQQSGSATKSSLGPICQIDVNSLVVKSLGYDSLSLLQLAHDHVSGRHRIPVAFELPQSEVAFWKALETLGEAQGTFAYWAELRAQRKDEIMSALLSQQSSLPLSLRAIQNGSGNNQTNCVQSIQAFDPYFIDGFPYKQRTPIMKLSISADHQLFVLIQCNALRGALTNMSIILYLSGHPLEGWASYYTEDLPTPPENSPPSLQPTQLQKAVPHESWIDIIPYPTLRDNIIRNQENLDADELCSDFLGGIYEGEDETQNRGMILWGQPWSENGWELSEGFARKWSLLLKGCDDLIKSTNRWRETRGEERLIVEV